MVWRVKCGIERCSGLPHGVKDDRHLTSQRGRRAFEAASLPQHQAPTAKRVSFAWFQHARLTEGADAYITPRGTAGGSSPPFDTINRVDEAEATELFLMDSLVMVGRACAAGLERRVTEVRHERSRSSRRDRVARGADR